MDITDPVLPRTLTDRASGRSLVVEQTSKGDIYVEFWVADPDDGRSVLLTVAQIRDLYDALGDRLRLLERHPATEVRTHLVKAHACHEDTVVLLDLTETEAAAGQKISAALAEESTGDCMPTLSIRIATPTDVAEYDPDPDEDV